MKKNFVLLLFSLTAVLVSYAADDKFKKVCEYLPDDSLFKQLGSQELQHNVLSFAEVSVSSYTKIFGSHYSNRLKMCQIMVNGVFNMLGKEEHDSELESLLLRFSKLDNTFSDMRGLLQFCLKTHLGKGPLVSVDDFSAEEIEKEIDYLWDAHEALKEQGIDKFR